MISNHKGTTNMNKLMSSFMFIIQSYKIANNIKIGHTFFTPKLEWEIKPSFDKT